MNWTFTLFVGLIACGGPGADGPGGGAGPETTRAPVEAPAVDPTPLALPSGTGAMTPSLTRDGEDLLYVWQEPEGGSDASWRVRFSRLHQGAWSASVDLVHGPQVFANWADFPGLAVAPEGALVAHWFEKTADAYDFSLARSSDGGVSWSPLPDPYPPDLAGERGFVSYAGEAEGLRVFWLDGRGVSGGHGASLAGATALYSAVLGADGFLPEAVVDDRTCDCCGTDGVAPGGHGLVVYRDRHVMERRDISAARVGVGSGVSVSEDGWTIHGCPVNGPAVDARGAQVVTAWFTGAGDRQAVRAAFSLDGGATFGPAVTVVDAAADARPLGRVDVLVDEDGTAIVSWLSAEGEDAAVRLRRVAADGRVGASRALGASGTSRAAGFPRLTWHAGQIVSAWAVPDAGNTAVRFAAGWVPSVGASVTPSEPATAPSQLPAFEAEDLLGARVSAEALRGNPVLVNVWATWCGPCREELSVLEALQRTHPHLRILALSVDGEAAGPTVRKMVEARAPSLTVLHPDTGGLAARLGVTALPRTFLYDTRGTLVWSSTGAVASDDPGLAAAITRASAP